MLSRSIRYSEVEFHRILFFVLFEVCYVAMARAVDMGTNTGPDVSLKSRVTTCRSKVLLDLYAGHDLRVRYQHRSSDSQLFVRSALRSARGPVADI